MELTNSKASISKLSHDELSSALVSLRTNMTVKEVWFSFQMFNDESIQLLVDAVSENKMISWLAIRGCKLSNDHLCRLCRVFASVDCVLTDLDVAKNPIGDEGAVALAGALKTNKKLSYLWLTRTNLEKEGACALADMLMTNMSLLLLDLSFNDDIGPDGCRAFATALRSNHTLTSISLTDIGLKAGESVCIWEMLKTNSSLKTIDLSYNNLENVDAFAIADMLLVNQRLKDLCISDNEIGPEGAERIFKTLKLNQHLSTLNLNDNPIGLQGARAVSEVLPLNYGLRKLMLSFAKIGHDGEKLVVDAMSRNFSLIYCTIDACKPFCSRNNEWYGNAKRCATVLLATRRFRKTSLNLHPIEIIATISHFLKLCV